MIDIDIVGQLFPNPLTMIVQLCSTLVLFLIARKFLWGSIKNWMAVRSDKMQADLLESEKAKQEALQDRQVALDQLKQASEKADQMIEAAQKEANVEKETILLNASKEAALTKQKAHEQIEAERLSMYNDMKKEMVEIAMTAAGKLIEEKNSEELDRQAIAAFVKEATDHDE